MRRRASVTRVVPVMPGEPVGAGGAGRTYGGGVGQRREVSKTSSRVAARALSSAPRSTGRSRTVPDTRRGREGEIGELGLDELAQHVPAGGGHRAGEDHDLGVQYGDQRGETGGQRGGVLLQEPQVRPLGTSGGLRQQRDRRADRRARPGPGRHPDAQRGRHPGHRLRAGQCLVAAGVDPGDLPDQGVARHGQEPDLARAAGPAAVQPAAEHQGGAEALLVPQQDEVPVAAGRAEALLGDRGEVHVVLVPDRHRQGRRQLLEEGGGVPAGQVLGVAQRPGVGIEGSRGGDDDAVEGGALEPGVLDGPAEGPGDPVDGPGALGVRELVAADHLAGEIGDGRDDAARGDVQSGDVGGARVDPVQLGVGSGAAAGGAGGHDQPGGLEAGQQLGGGGLGEPGEPADPGTGQGPVLQQQVQRRAVVHDAQQAGRSGRGHERSLRHRLTPWSGTVR